MSDVTAKLSQARLVDQVCQQDLAPLLCGRAPAVHRALMRVRAESVVGFVAVI